MNAHAHTLKLFHETSRRVPAYKDFLKKHDIKHEAIKTWKDFQNVPPVSKQNYLRKYNLEELCWDGTLQKKSFVFTATSGSTGEPFYFPRTHSVDSQSSEYHRLFLKNNKGDRTTSTLVIVGFGMGVWIGGIITYQAFRMIAERGLPITILTPGVNKKEIFEALKNIALKFKEVILCGYPPFIKDIIDEAKKQGISWDDFHLKIIFAAESFSEKFRDYIVKKAHIKNIYTDIANIYGSADLGTMAIETPLCVLIRRLAMHNGRLSKALFANTNRLPTLAQFNPRFLNFESVHGTILCTGDSAIPLVRYDLGDTGSIIGYDAMMILCRDAGIDLTAKIKAVGLTETIDRFPFIEIYERKDLSTKLFGAIIYPEHVREGMHHKVFEDIITGKFSMSTKTNRQQNEYLEINIELKPNVKISQVMERQIQSSIVDSLSEKNAEYNNNINMLGNRVHPKIIFWDHEHPEHFKPGGKQKWIKA